MRLFITALMCSFVLSAGFSMPNAYAGCKDKNCPMTKAGKKCDHKKCEHCNKSKDKHEHKDEVKAEDAKAE